MKYLIYSFLLVLVSGNPLRVNAQSVNETVDIINYLLKLNSVHTAKHIFPYFLYSQIEIDSTGLIASYIYEKNPEGMKIVKIPNCHGYLKSLNAVVVAYEDTGIYQLNLICPKGNKCLFNGHGNIIATDPIGMGFSISNLEAQSKIENALMHLMVLAKTTSTFYTKDPLAK